MEATFKTREDFRQGRKGRRVRTAYFLVVQGKAAPGTYGLVVGKPAGKRAVTRNRVKRVLREELSQVSRDKSLLVQVVEDVTSVDNKTLREDFARAVKTLGLLKA